MKDFFTIGEAAKAVNVTAETLRHYDRIGLVKPCKKDEWTNYRYYTRQDIVRLNTVRALQQMDLPLSEIRNVLEYDDLEKIIAFLAEAERKADEKIRAIKNSKAKILAAKLDYENKLRELAEVEGCNIKNFPARTILLSDTFAVPSLDNLWNYLSHFYDKLPENLKEQFAFENTAGVYIKGGSSAMFALCSRFADIEGLVTLPNGMYLCADCKEEDGEKITNRLLKIAEKEYGVIPEFTVRQILISGILKWKYQIQVYIGETI